MALDEYGGASAPAPHSNGIAHGTLGQPQQVYPPPASTPGAPATKPIYDPHPLFELEDGQLEHRDIVLLSFKRKNAEGKLIPQPESIPAKEVRSWADVARWWGGGYYRVTARNAAGLFAGQFPAGDDLYFIDGPEKPFTVRDRIPITAVQAPGPAAPAPAQPAPAAVPAALPVDPMQFMREFSRDLLGAVRDELREARAPAAAAQSNTGVEMMLGMFKLQGEEARARADQAVAEAKARAESDAARARADADVRMQEIRAATEAQNNMWAALKGGGGGEESKFVALMLKMMPTPMDPLALMKAMRETAGPAPEADEFKPITDIVGKLIAADAMKTQAPQVAPPAPPPPPRPEPRPRGPIEYVPGVGAVEVVAPERSMRTIGAAPPEPPVVAPAPEAVPPAPAPAAPAAAAAPAPAPVADVPEPRVPAAAAPPAAAPVAAPTPGPIVEPLAPSAPPAAASPASPPAPASSLGDVRSEVSVIFKRVKGLPEPDRVAFLMAIPPFRAQATTLASILGSLSDTDIDDMTAQVGMAELQSVLAMQPNGIAHHGG